MTQDPLDQALARIVREVPGVAFLTPGFTDRLRTAFQGPQAAARTPSGLRISRSRATGRWEIDVRVVTLSGSRALDVTRATRSAVLTHLLAHHSPGTAGAAVTVTVTGVV
ncbi:Asp23/Gls24 family envelope stress response protein [Streptomyces sp. NPDC048383]|uniref:Asp23/Gls24 family envelope stress response protein n=1 Tax=Streptomyces sp. NPDC048383 TaxID=3155386 RepID=UPI00341CDF93